MADHEIGSQARAVRARGGPRTRVLVGDESADLREYIANLLAPTCDVATAHDGIAARDAIRARPPDLFVGDVMMPRLDGVALVRELRADPSTAALPVILLAARADEEDAVAGLDAGADDYLIKPFSAHELRARVRINVELARVRRAWGAELRAHDEEREAFNHAVAHDLRAPLRAIDGFARALADDYDDRLDERARDYLQRVRAAASRMGALIDDLLQLARVIRSPLRKGPVDLSALAGQIAADLRRRDPARVAEIVIAPGLVAAADSALLRVVLECLIGNAWKFSSLAPAASIEIGAIDRDGERVYCVRDNGVGFDMDYGAKLFRPFQRLHAATEFAGTGMGLATVARIVSRHGGRVWAEGVAGSGATVYFTL